MTPHGKLFWLWQRFGNFLWNSIQSVFMQPASSGHLRNCILKHSNNWPWCHLLKIKQYKRHQQLCVHKLNLWKNCLAMKILQILLWEVNALSNLATICLSTNELQRQKIRELALGLQATLIDSQPLCTMAPFFSLTLSYIIIAVYWGRIMICTSIQPGWHAS